MEFRHSPADIDAAYVLLALASQPINFKTRTTHSTPAACEPLAYLHSPPQFQSRSDKSLIGAEAIGDEMAPVPQTINSQGFPAPESMRRSEIAASTSAVDCGEYIYNTSPQDVHSRKRKGEALESLRKSVRGKGEEEEEEEEVYLQDDAGDSGRGEEEEDIGYGPGSMYTYVGGEKRDRTRAEAKEHFGKKASILGNTSGNLFFSRGSGYGDDGSDDDVSHVAQFMSRYPSPSPGRPWVGRLTQTPVLRTAESAQVLLEEILESE